MIIETLIIVFGLCVFEIICSVDNAIINASVLRTMSYKYRKIFLFWGILFAVFVVRGLLPFVIVWATNTSLTIPEVFTACFSENGEAARSMEKSKPLLLLGGGIYLLYVALSWLFLEEKNYAFLVERFLKRQSVWFYAIVSVVTTVLVFVSIRIDPTLALAATFGVSAFFITDGFKKNAEEKERELLTGNLSAWSKILYLEVLDTSFSIDGVIGAFAFTLSVPLIIIGNGLGAFVVRELTIQGIDVIAQYAYLKNGAMYSIGVLGTLMILESFGQEHPFWLAPLNTIVILSFFMILSVKEIKQAHRKK